MKIKNDMRTVGNCAFEPFIHTVHREKNTVAYIVRFSLQCMGLGHTVKEKLQTGTLTKPHRGNVRGTVTHCTISDFLNSHRTAP